MGWGRVGQHRKSGMKGGRGKAGMHKHKWSYTVKYEPEHFGKHGFKSLKKPIKEINVGDLERFIENGRYSLDNDGTPIIDLIKEGYDKLIGRGRINVKVKVLTKAASERATEKIRSAGGEVILKR